MSASAPLGRTEGGRHCSVCDHPRLGAINRLLAQGRSYRDIAGRFGLSKSAVERHGNAHVPTKLVEAAQAADAADASSVLELTRDLLVDIREMFEEARDKGDTELAMKVCDRVDRQLDRIAKITGELQPPAQVQINVLNTPAYLEVKARMVRALEPFPEAREALVQALEQEQ